MKIKGIEFLRLEMVFNTKIPNGNVNLGLVRLKCEDRTFVLDTIETRWLNEGNGTTLSIKLEAGIDGCTKDECDSNFDITASDFLNKKVKGTLWIEEDIEDVDGVIVEPESISLFYRYEDSLVSVIDLKIE